MFQNDVELYYKFSPLLMQYIPKDIVNAWIEQGKQLEPKRLIPALVQYDHQKYREQVENPYMKLPIENGFEKTLCYKLLESTQRFSATSVISYRCSRH